MRIRGLMEYKDEKLRFLRRTLLLSLVIDGSIESQILTLKPQKLHVAHVQSSARQLNELDKLPPYSATILDAILPESGFYSRVATFKEACHRAFHVYPATHSNIY